MAAAETSQTLDRALRLLELLADEQHGRAGLTVTELAAALGVARPVVYRLLGTLAEHRLVRRSDDGRVRLGIGVLSLAQRVHPLLREAAAPVLRRLADEVRATAHLTIADGGEALAVVVVEPTRTDFHVSYRVGSRHPLDRGAAGRAILAGRRGDRDVVSTDSELQPGAVGVAAPVPLTELDASVGVVALGDLDRPLAHRAVRAAAAEVAAALA
ncbi:IclR family transcriptional regulator [Quadrisphaera sp. GCM10027208]|uniref:IclR family transcriptional regulator n=1 Tax=Quadrisphaera sp. GCM10027208 TaxID=3273423 RepID=UPI0036231A9C